MQQDPKRPQAIVSFVMPQKPAEDIVRFIGAHAQESDLAGTLGMGIGIVSLILKYKYLSILGLFCSLYSFLGLKESEAGGSRLSSSGIR